MSEPLKRDMEPSITPIKFGSLCFRRLSVLHSDLAFLCANAAVEIEQVGEGNKEYSYTNFLAKLLTMASRELREAHMSPLDEDVLRQVLSKYSDRKVECRDGWRDDLAMRIALIASELESARELPSDTLKKLSEFCLDLGKKSMYYRSLYSHLHGRRYLAA